VVGQGTVRVFWQKFTLEDAIGSHACSLEANTRVTNGIPRGCSLLLLVDTVNSVQTLKVCIDQANIRQSLKCLPVYLMACNSMLVLGGTTYIDRLWCVWELYTLFAVSDQDPKLIVRDFSGGDSTLTDRLAAFSLGEHANCYDPNEKAKLLQAIRAAPGGENAFNKVIRSLADTVNKAQSTEMGRASVFAQFRKSIKVSSGSRASTVSRASSLGSKGSTDSPRASKRSSAESNHGKILKKPSPWSGASDTKDFPLSPIPGTPATPVALSLPAASGEVRGECGRCGQPVFDSEERDKDEATGTYAHVTCPTACSA
jgi:hypothetical protein